MDHFRRKTFGDEIVFGGAVGAPEELFDRIALEARAQTRDAEFVGKRAEIGTQGDTPHSRRAPWVNEPIHSPGEPGERAGREAF